MNTSTPDPTEPLQAEIQRLRDHIAALETRAVPDAPPITTGPPLWFDSVGDAIFVSDATWIIQHWNQAAAQLYGWSPAEAIGRPISELIFVARYLDGNSDEGATQTLLSTGIWRGSFVQRTRDGHEVVVEGSTRALTDAQGTITGYIGINRDITARVRAEEAQRASEVHYRILFETMAQGVIYHDSDGQIIAANPMAEQILGLTLDALQGRASLDPRWHAIHEDGTPFPGEEHPAMVALRTGQEVRDVVMGVYHPGLDAYRWITVQAVPHIEPGTSRPRDVYAIFGDITERRQVAQALEYERKQLAAILNTMHEGIIATHPDGALVLINPAAMRLRDLDPVHPPATVMDLGQTPHRLFDAHGNPVARENLPLFRVLRGERFAGLELCQRHIVSGDEHWHLINGAPVYDEKGTFILGVVTFKDITDRKRDEAQLRQQAAMLDHAHILVRDAASRITSWNQGAQRLYGWTVEEAIGHISHELLQTRFPTSLEEVQAQLFERDRWEGELVHHRRDGSAVVVASLQLLFRDPSGTPTHILEVNNDVTALTRAEGQLRLALDAAELGTWRLDDASGTVTLDARARAHFGVADETLPFATLATCIHPEDRARVQREAQELRHNKYERQVHTEYRVIHPDGSVHWLALHTRYLFSGVGATRTIVGAHGATQEITARKGAEAALLAHAETLSKTNAELSYALKLKDEFLAMMSHELRTPLNVILGYTEGLEEEVYGPLTERQRKALNTVSQSGRHLLGILTDILDMVHLEGGRTVLATELIAVDHLCRAATQLVYAAAQKKGIQLSRTVAVGVEAIRADERRLTQILINLLDNAIKFTPAGGRVGLEVTANTAHEQIAFTVWDTGIGIAEADYPRLFRPFTQLDGRLARDYEGIGLGLSLVLRLVELHGGSIQVESTPGQGSRFTVSLPWAEADNVTPPTARAPLPEPHAWATPPRLVIADDHEETLSFYRERLAEEGCTVAVARTGTEAVVQVQATHPDVAILDIQMPKQDGLTAIRQIRANPEVSATPIIALSALAMPGDRDRCLEAGANTYLAKPVGIRALITAIAEVLAGSKTGRTGA